MKIINKYWYIIIAFLVLVYFLIFKKKHIIIKRGDNNENVKKYQTILKQLLIITIDNDFNDNDVINKVYVWMDEWEEICIANKWSLTGLNIDGNFGSHTETLGLKLKELYSIPGIANQVNLSTVSDWFEKQNTASLQNAI